MKIIAHRCNLNGPDPKRENKIAAMRECIERGFDVEIDVRANEREDVLYFGHDHPQERADWDELAAHSESLWLHCKNFEALRLLANRGSNLHYFWHDSDDYTLTSNNFIWAYPGRAYTANSVIVLPERGTTIDKLHALTRASCYAICTDYPVVTAKG